MGIIKPTGIDWNSVFSERVFHWWIYSESDPKWRQEGVGELDSIKKAVDALVSAYGPAPLDVTVSKVLKQ